MDRLVARGVALISACALGEIYEEVVGEPTVTCQKHLGFTLAASRWMPKPSENGTKLTTFP